jgi:hypothetical protein
MVVEFIFPVIDDVLYKLPVKIKLFVVDPENIESVCKLPYINVLKSTELLYDELTDADNIEPLKYEPDEIIPSINELLKG